MVEVEEDLEVGLEEAGRFLPKILLMMVLLTRVNGEIPMFSVVTGSTQDEGPLCFMDHDEMRGLFIYRSREIFAEYQPQPPMQIDT